MMKTLPFLTVALVFAAATLCGVDSAEARTFRAAQIPNGAQPGADCGVCHTNANTGGALNVFGTTVMDAGLDTADPPNVVWSAICQMDSDGDGYTNGEELGDTDCTWEFGDAEPTPSPSFPGDADSIACGNGVIDGNSINADQELCDTDEFGDATCEALTQRGGDLACNSECQISTDNCIVMPGNNGTNNGTNNATTPTTNNNNNATNNANNQPGPTNNNTEPEPEEDAGDVGMACDGELDVEEGGTKSSVVLIAMLLMGGLWRRRDI